MPKEGITATMLIIKILYDMSGNPPIIKTNCKRECISEILGEWLSCQMGAGEDHSKAKELDVYHITIVLDLSDDSFVCRSNTGNKGLTAGIVMTVLNMESNWVVCELDVAMDEASEGVI
jgi:hypothetical protein